MRLVDQSDQVGPVVAFREALADEADIVCRGRLRRRRRGARRPAAPRPADDLGGWTPDRPAPPGPRHDGGPVRLVTTAPRAGTSVVEGVERAIDNGYIRVNIFHETIKNVIENQTNTTAATSVTTFFPIDEVETRGAEFIVNAQDLPLADLDIRFNITYSESEIKKNTANPALVGKTPPRMPQWRGNLLATYHLTDDWDFGGSLQYAGDSFGRPDNLDIQDEVYGAQDAYTRLGLKSNYRFNNRWKISAGVDNLTDEISYVAHPWPGRTFYFTAAWEL